MERTTIKDSSSSVAAPKISIVAPKTTRATQDLSYRPGLTAHFSPRSALTVKVMETRLNGGNSSVILEQNNARKVLDTDKIS